MTGKKVTSVSIDHEVYERLKEDEGVNFSGFVNNVAREYVESGSVDGLSLRIKEKENRIEELEEELQNEKEELEQLKETREQRQEKTSPEMEKAFDVVSDLVKNGHADVDNPAVKTQAQKVGMSPSALLETVREEVDTPRAETPADSLTSLTDGGSVGRE